MKDTFTTATLLIALTASPLLTASVADAAGGAAQPAAICAANYTVQPGDNLFRVGLKYGVAWPVIAAANNLANGRMIFAGQVLCIPAAGAATQTPVSVTKTPAPTPGTNTPTPSPTLSATSILGKPVPTFSITGVARDQTVSISAINFPANTIFSVLMGPYGALGVNGTAAGTQASATGTFTASFGIPTSLKGMGMIAIRLQSTSGYFSYNWFYN